jgi:hypothetical protein
MNCLPGLAVLRISVFPVARITDRSLGEHSPHSLHFLKQFYHPFPFAFESAKVKRFFTNNLILD